MPGPAGESRPECRPLTVLVEPNPDGHRFQWVSHVVRALAHEGSDVLLLTSTGATATAEFATFLADLPVTCIERFDRIYPHPREVGAALLEVQRERPIERFVIMDSDQLVKKWWLHAPRELRSYRGRPFGVLLMTRFPSRILPDRSLLWLRSSKALLTILAMVSGSAHRMAYVAGRDQLRQGVLFKRLRDPAICAAHASQRTELRAGAGLPLDRRLVGILGKVDERKSVPLVADAVFAADPQVDLLLAGGLADEVRSWLDALPVEKRERVHLRDGFLPEVELDELTACCDVIAVVHLNHGPSGIMGKAQVAGVPVLSAGSRVRRRETAALGSGVHTDITVDGLAEGLRALLARGSDPVPPPLSLPTAEEFGEVVLTGGPRPLGKFSRPRPRHR